LAFWQQSGPKPIPKEKREGVKGHRKRGCPPFAGEKPTVRVNPRPAKKGPRRDPAKKKKVPPGGQTNHIQKRKKLHRMIPAAKSVATGKRKGAKIMSRRGKIDLSSKNKTDLRRDVEEAILPGRGGSGEGECTSRQRPPHGGFKLVRTANVKVKQLQRNWAGSENPPPKKPAVHAKGGENTSNHCPDPRSKRKTMWLRRGEKHE